MRPRLTLLSSAPLGTYVAAMRDPTVMARMIEQGLEVVANTPAEMTTFQAREFARWKALIESRKITAD